MKYIKYSLVIFLCVMSFYFSDRLIMMVENMSPIMKSVKAGSEALRTEAVNAIIDGNTIIPGKYGKVVNERESYLKMNDFGTFNETFYVYDYIKPDVSLEDHLDKIIIKGNDEKSVSLIVNDEKITEYLKSEKIAYTRLVKEIEEVKDEEYVNANLNKEDYETLNTYLKRKKMNSKICLVEKSNMEACKKNGYYLVSPTLVITHSNLASMKSKIEGSNIIELDKSLTLNEVKIIISAIKYKNLQFVCLSKFISER